MPAYKQLYYQVFNEVSKAIEMLQRGQQECEELYMNGDGNEDEAGKEQREQA